MAAAAAASALRALLAGGLTLRNEGYAQARNDRFVFWCRCNLDDAGARTEKANVDVGS